jgi:hypothetical protein
MRRTGVAAYRHSGASSRSVEEWWVPFRFTMALVVFLLSFGMGLGGTYLLVSASGGLGQSASSSAVVAGAGPSVAPVGPALPAAIIQPAAPTTAEPPQPLPEEASATVAVEVAAPEAPAPVEPQVAVEAEPEATPAEPVQVAAAARPAESDLAAEEAPWWSDLRGRTCVIDLDAVGFSSLSLREGEFDHNRLVDWDADFGSAKRLRIFWAASEPAVEVLALGFDADGMPTAATVRVPGTDLLGVIALQIEGRVIPLRPTDS